METYNIVQIEIRNGEYYYFYEFPPDLLVRNAGYIFLIIRKYPGEMNHDFLFIGTSYDLPKFLKKKEVLSFFEVNKATHILTFRVDDEDEMAMMKEKLLEKYPSIKQELKPKRSKKVLT